MDDENNVDDSIALNLLSKAIAVTAGDEAADQLRSGAEKVIPPGFDGQDLDSAVLAGSIGGFQFSQARRLADAAERPATEPSRQTPVKVREIEHPDGTVHSVRIFVAAERANFQKNDDGVEVRVEGQVYPVPTTFTPHEVNIEKAEDGIIEAVVTTPPMIGDGSE